MVSLILYYNQENRKTEISIFMENTTHTTHTSDSVRRLQRRCTRRQQHESSHRLAICCYTVSVVRWLDGWVVRIAWFYFYYSRCFLVSSNFVTLAVTSQTYSIYFDRTEWEENSEGRGWEKRKIRKQSGRKNRREGGWEKREKKGDRRVALDLLFRALRVYHCYDLSFFYFYTIF